MKKKRYIYLGMKTNNYLMNDKKQVEIDDLDLEILEIISTEDI